MMESVGQIGTELEDLDRRTVQVHAPAYGAFAAASKMFGNVASASELTGFRLFLRDKCAAAAEQKESMVNVNQVLRDLISAVRENEFGDTGLQMRRFFKVWVDKKDHPPGAVNVDEHGQYVQGRWDSVTLFIDMNGVMGVLQKYLRQRGRELVLDLSDLKDQMSRRPYWSDKNKRRLQQRFEGGRLDCWAFDLDKMGELGYRPVSDEEYWESKRNGHAPELPGSSTWPEPKEWVDPRKGDLFAIVEAIEEKK